MKLRNLMATVCLTCIATLALAQAGIVYQDIYNRDWFGVGFGSYGRIGISWTPDNISTQGRRLNLNNMGSVGGRMEEQDYLELGLAFHMRPVALQNDSTEINVQFRTSVFSRSVALFGNSNTESFGGLAIALPEMFAEARNVFTEGLDLWVGARFYRGADIHMADYFYFNDHSGQGAGIAYKNTRFHVNFVGSTDTTATVPPYFFLNIKSGTQSLEIRNRVVYSLEHDIALGTGSMLTLLGEYHRIGDPGRIIDSTNILLSFPSDYGWVLGAKHQLNIFPDLRPGSFHHLAVRYGSRIANGGDGGSTRTWETFGAVDTTDFKFQDAYAWHIVDHFLINFSPRFSLNGYLVYNQSRGAAASSDRSETYLGREVFNRKEDFTVGLKGVNYLTDSFHWQTELHYSQRKDGTQDWYRMVKLSLVPTLAIRGERSVWSRPHFRFIYSLAWFNELTRDHLYSPYLDLAGPKKWGHFFGIRAEWWTW